MPHPVVDPHGPEGDHPSWVAKVEMGERRLDLVEFIRVCRALGQDPPPIVRKIAAAI